MNRPPPSPPLIPFRPPCPRLAALFLRSRATGPVLGALAIGGLLAATLLPRVENATLVAFLLALLPLAPAVLVGTATASPIGEAEQTSSRPLPPLRLGHLGLLLGTVGLALLATALLVPTPIAILPLLRNAAGLTGLALLGARLLGAPHAWALPVAHLTLVGATLGHEQRPDRWWLWPHPDAPTVQTLAAALLTLLFGLALVVSAGAREPRPNLA